MILTRRTALALLTASVASPVLEKTAFAVAQEPLSSASSVPSPPPHNAAYKQATLPVEMRVRDLLGRMTIEEKARQLDMYAGVTYPVHTPLAIINLIKKTGFQPKTAEQLWGNIGVGSIHDLHPSADLSNAIQKWVIQNTRLGIPVLFIEAGLHGYTHGTTFPSPVNLSATWNPEIVRKIWAAIAAEGRACGADVIPAPVLNLARDPRWGRVEECFGEDPYLVGQLGLACVQGGQGDSLSTDHTIVPCIKHFAAHGSPESGTNTSPAHMGERELRTIMLKAFEPAVRQGHAMCVMAAYNEIDGVPITADPQLLIRILREEWGFQGFVLSDLGAIRRLYDKHHVAATPKDAICLAINSGVDMQFYDFDHKTFQDAIRAGIQDGTLSSVALDRAVTSILRVKFELGLFDRPVVNPKLDAIVRRSQAHLDLALESARQSMILLKNDNHLLPLSKSLKKIAVIGPNANVARYGDYSDPNEGERISMLTGIKAILPDATITFDDGKDIQAAVAKAKDAEIAILGLGEWQGLSGEGFDRSNLDLPGNQKVLLEAVAATGKPVVLVLQNGRPLTIDWAAKHIPAILEAWYPAEFGGRAIAETIFGDNNPAGRLTITFPQTVGQLPDYYNYDPSKKLDYVDCNGKPLFPFGFGLSYTTFTYERITVKPPAAGSKADIVITCDVKNTGAVAGNEVAQLYVRENVTTVETPIKSLKGFSRIYLRPGEARTVTFHLPQDELAIWNEQERWVVEPGTFTLWVGGSSEATLSTQFTLM